MKSRIDDLVIIEDNIRWLKEQIEKWASPDSENKDLRQEFYKKTLGKLSKELQRNILIEIHSIVAFGKPGEKDLRSKKKDNDYRKHLRKRSEYIRRAKREGKSPKVEPRDPAEYYPYPTHRPKGSAHKGVSYSFLRGLHRAVREAGLPNPYEKVSHVLYIFLGIEIIGDHIKRMLIRRKEDIRELDEFEKLSDGPPVED
jgi:hypothetical protein